MGPGLGPRAQDQWTRAQGPAQWTSTQDLGTNEQEPKAQHSGWPRPLGPVDLENGNVAGLANGRLSK